LAKLFDAREGGEADATAAAKYYEQAANYGIKDAQYRLGVMLSADQNNAANLQAGYKWLILAADSMKESPATVTAQQVRKLLTSAQVAQAEQEIDAWRTAHSR
jgi:localization factor PodJL